jgi:hypothetical protein
MSNQFLKLRRSAIPGRVPTTSSLDFGEIALNTYDGLAFIKKSGSSGEQVIAIGAGTSGNISGTDYFIPIFSGSNALVTSSFYQSGSFTGLRTTTPSSTSSLDVFLADGTGVNTYNIIGGHGNLNGFIQLNIQNFSNGSNASSDIVATNDAGDNQFNYIDMGINSSQFTSNVIGGPNDAYLYSTGNDLYIGNARGNQKVVIFNGGYDTNAYAKIYIHPEGVTSFNTSTFNVTNPAAITVRPTNNTTNNLIQAVSNVDNYTQISVANESTGATASADIVAYNNIDPSGQQSGYIDMGIASTNYIRSNIYPSAAGDAYVFTDSSHLILGAISASGNTKITLFAGGINEIDNAKLVLYSNNQHKMSGSLNVSGSVTAKSFTGSLFGTASWATNALTASYFSGIPTSASYASSSTSASYASTASWALNFITSSVTSASYAATASLALNFITSSVTSASFASTASYGGNFTASYLLVNNTITAQTLVVQTITSSVEYSSGSNIFGNQLTNTQQFTGSVSITGSLNLNGFSAITANQTGSMSVSSSIYAATASYFITSSVTSASYAATASYISASGIAGLNISQISLGVVTASVNLGNNLFNIVSGSNTLVVVDSTGSIGLGTTSPGYKLDVQGSGRFTTNLTAAAGKITLGDGQFSDPVINFTAASKTTYIGVVQSAGAFINAGGIGDNFIRSQDNTRYFYFGSGTGGASFFRFSYSDASIIIDGNGTGNSFTTISSSQLTVNSTTKGFLPTRTDLTSNISSPAQGLITYVTASATEGLWYYSSGSIIGWTRVLNSTGSQVISGSLTATSFTGSLLGTSSYALTASYVANASSFPYTGSAVITGSLIVTGSTSVQTLNVGASQFNNTSSITVAGTTTISQLATGSYISAFYNYAILSASNARSGQIMSIWSGSSVKYTEVTTTDLGNTATASFAVALSGNNVQLNFTAPGSWTVRSIANLL